MAVLINWNICDNADACAGIEVCPTGSLFWDEKKAKIGINNDLCISCRRCVNEEGCPIGAILVTETEEEFILAQQIIENDTHNKEQLFVERYGATPIDESLCITKQDIGGKVKEDVVLIEKFVNDDRVRCLLYSIKVDDIRYSLALPSMKYYKCEIIDDDGKDYPRLEIYKDGSLLGVIEDYFDDSQTDEFIREIKEILN